MANKFLKRFSIFAAYYLFLLIYDYWELVSQNSVRWQSICIIWCSDMDRKRIHSWIIIISRIWGLSWWAEIRWGIYLNCLLFTAKIKHFLLISKEFRALLALWWHRFAMIELTTMHGITFHENWNEPLTQLPVIFVHSLLQIREFHRKFP